MPIEDLHIIGAGGHALVVADAVRCGSPEVRLAFFDDDPAGSRLASCGETVLPFSGEAIAGRPYHVAMGNNDARESIWRALSRSSGPYLAVIHPRAVIAARAEIGDGVFLAAGCIVGPAAHVEEGAIVNHLAVVDHECVVGGFAHIAPGARLAVVSSLAARC